MESVKPCHRKTSSGLKPRRKKGAKVGSRGFDRSNLEGNANPFQVCFERLRMNACRSFLAEDLPCAGLQTQQWQ
jgi:hypothetical protein